jgi:hypothetical protein
LPRSRVRAFDMAAGRRPEETLFRIQRIQDLVSRCPVRGFGAPVLLQLGR